MTYHLKHTHMEIDFPIPSGYDGAPVSLRNIASRSVRERLLEGILKQEDLVPQKIHAITSTLVEHFTGKKMDEHYGLYFFSHKEFPFNGLIEEGFNYGPICVVPLSHPLSMAITAFHEVGHAMFPSPDVNAQEAAAVYISHLFAQKLATEQPMLENILKCLGNSCDDANARDLLNRNDTPHDMFTYPVDYVSSHPFLKVLIKGQKVTFEFGNNKSHQLSNCKE